MEFYGITVILTCLIQVRDGHKVPAMSVCSSMCSLKKDGSFFQVTCRANTPNSFRVDTDPKSVFTGKQMIQRIFREGISGASCVEDQNDRKKFLAKTVYMTCDRGTFSYNMKKGKWRELKTKKIIHLCADPVGKRVLGVRENVILSIKGNRIHAFLLCGDFLDRITGFDFDVTTKEAFILDNRNNIFRMRKALPKLSANSNIRCLRLDQRNRKIYILRGNMCILCASYDGIILKEFSRKLMPILFMGHFDKIENGVLVRYRKKHNFCYMPGKKMADLPIATTVDVDYDDEYVYVLSSRGRVTTMKRGKPGLRKLGTVGGCSIGFSFAVL